MSKTIELDMSYHEALREERAINELVERLAEMAELKYQSHTLHAPIVMAHAQVAIIALQARERLLNAQRDGLVKALQRIADYPAVNEESGLAPFHMQSIARAALIMCRSAIKKADQGER